MARNSGKFIWCGYQDHLPQFGKIYDIFIVKKLAFLCVNIYCKRGNFRGVKNFAVFMGIFITTKFNFDCLSRKFSYSCENHVVLLEKTKDVNTEVCSPD